MVDDIDQLGKLLTNLTQLSRSIGVEENFLQQIVVLVEYALGNVHVTFESSTRSILMLHHSSKNESAGKRNTQRVSHGLVVLIEGVLVHVESQLLVQILEEYLAHIVAFLDDDGILL